MSADRTQSFDIGHPAPGAAVVGAVWLWLSFLAAPVLWSLQLAAGSAIAGLACVESSGTRDTTRYEWAAVAAQAVNLAALALAVGALVLSIVHLRRTRAAAPEPAGGAMAAGEGRAHFMAVWAVFTSVLFIGAIAFNTFSVFWGGLCPG